MIADTEEVQRGSMCGGGISGDHGTGCGYCYWLRIVHHQNHFSSDAHSPIPLLQWSVCKTDEHDSHL